MKLVEAARPRRQWSRAYGLGPRPRLGAWGWSRAKLSGQKRAAALCDNCGSLPTSGGQQRGQRVASVAGSAARGRPERCPASSGRRQQQPPPGTRKKEFVASRSRPVVGAARASAASVAQGTALAARATGQPRARTPLEQRAGPSAASRGSYIERAGQPAQGSCAQSKQWL